MRLERCDGDGSLPPVRPPEPERARPDLLDRQREALAVVHSLQDVLVRLTVRAACCASLDRHALGRDDLCERGLPPAVL
eukprot:4379050-Pleurochrysis_carterae.AAC.1